jgi:glycopeptide antibiotics resistance protein
VISGEVVWLAWPVVAAAVLLWQRHRWARWPQALAALALAAYAWWICSVAFFPIPLPPAVASLRAGGQFQGYAWVNLIPLRELIHSLPALSAARLVREFGGNLLLFVPFTLFAPLLWPRLRTWWWPLAAGVGGSLAIEVLQLVLAVIVGYPYRQTDVDDVIVNASGAFLGYALAVLLRRWVTWRRAAPGRRRAGPDVL